MSGYPVWVTHCLIVRYGIELRELHGVFLKHGLRSELRVADDKLTDAMIRRDRLYPLLQRVYVELGHPDQYFNDRVVEVIDHLLETPEVAPPIKVKAIEVEGQPAKPDRSAPAPRRAGREA